MIYKTLSPLPGHVRVTFELPSCIWADRIYLVGDFNQWCEQATPMRQDRDGVWRATIDLKQGTQAEFRYLIDGQWRTDFHADGETTNTFGSQNSVARAELPEAVVPAIVQQSSRARERTRLGPVATGAPITTRQLVERSRSQHAGVMPLRAA